MEKQKLLFLPHSQHILGISFIKQEFFWDTAYFCTCYIVTQIYLRKALRLKMLTFLLSFFLLERVFPQGQEGVIFSMEKDSYPKYHNRKSVCVFVCLGVWVAEPLT